MLQLTCWDVRGRALVGVARPPTNLSVKDDSRLPAGPGPRNGCAALERRTGGVRPAEARAPRARSCGRMQPGGDSFARARGSDPQGDAPRCAQAGCCPRDGVLERDRKGRGKERGGGSEGARARARARASEAKGLRRRAYADPARAQLCGPVADGRGRQAGHHSRGAVESARGPADVPGPGPLHPGPDAAAPALFRRRFSALLPASRIAPHRIARCRPAHLSRGLRPSNALVCDGKRGGSARAELEHAQVETMCKFFTERRVPSEQYWCREGEQADALAIVLVGSLAVQNDHDDKPSGFLLPGDIIGDRELCGQNIHSSSVQAVEPSLLAEVGFQVLSNYIEGMGLKKARRLSKIIADDVLERVKEEKARLEEQVQMTCRPRPAPVGSPQARKDADLKCALCCSHLLLQDRQKLANIGLRRRGAICAVVNPSSQVQGPSGGHVMRG